MRCIKEELEHLDAWVATELISLQWRRYRGARRHEVFLDWFTNHGCKVVKQVIRKVCKFVHDTHVVLCHFVNCISIGIER